MKLILLPGNVPTNKQWAHNAAQAFSDTATDILEQNYTHWETGAKIIDFDAELVKLSEALQGENEYIIFGKSAGAVLAIYGVSAGALKPERCVFAGLPIKWAEKNKFPLREWLTKFNIPTVLVEQSEDPVGPYAEVQAYLAELEINSIQTIEIPGNDHDYNDLDAIKALVQEFLLGKEKEKITESNLKKR